MPLIELKCTNCGADIHIESSLEKAYCSYCGTQFIISEILDKTTRINEDHKIEPLLTLASMAYDSGDYQKCIEHADSVIVIQPNNPKAWYLKGCASEDSGTGDPTTCFLKASLFTNDEDLKKAINDRTAGVIEHKSKEKKLKITIQRCKSLIQPWIIIYVDKKQVCKIKAGDCDIIKLTEGKHEFSITQSGALFSSWKQSVIIDKENELIVKIDSGKWTGEFRS